MRALAEDFKMDKKVYDELMKSPCEDLDDLRFFFSTEDEVDQFTARTGLKDDALRLQSARMKKAWFSLRQLGRERDSLPSQSSRTELDDLLGEGDLKMVKTSFWRRYKLRFPPEVHPSDQLISRSYRELPPDHVQQQAEEGG